MVAASEVEVWRVPSPSRPCAYCRQDVGPDPATSCPRCDAVYHSDCWASNLSRCAIYGCEPAPKPAIRPMRVPDVPAVTRSMGGLAWLAPLVIVGVLGFARMGSRGEPSGSYLAAPPFPPRIHRHMDPRYDMELLTDFRESLVQVPAEDRAGLLEEAQALEDSASSLSGIPDGPLTLEVRALLLETVRSDLVTLKRSSKLYRRCNATQAEPELTGRIAAVTERISRKRDLLLKLMSFRETD